MLGRALAMEWMSGVNFLEAAICVTCNLSAYASGVCKFPRRLFSSHLQPIKEVHTRHTQADVEIRTFLRK